MTVQPFKLRRQKDWIGLKVESVRPLANSLGTVPAGTIFRIETSARYLSAISDPCPHCGIQLYILRVSPEDFRPRFDLTDLRELNESRRHRGMEPLIWVLDEQAGGERHD